MNNYDKTKSAFASTRAKRASAAAFVGAILAFSTVEARATELFLNFPGVQGESTNARHRGEIGLKSFGTISSNNAAITGSGGGASRPVCGQVTIVKTIDRASPQLLGLMFSGRHTGAPGTPVTVTFEKTSGENLLDYYKVDLFNVAVTSVAQSDSETDIIRETVTLHATRFIYTYRPQNTDGSLGAPVTTGWDCALNARV